MKKGIIVASFGTSYEETRKKCIETIEDKIKENIMITILQGLLHLE